MRKNILLFALLLATLLPLNTNAQIDSQREQLRQEFRAALLADPRAQEISEDELNAMVESLAEETETKDAVSDFILPPLPENNPRFSDGAYVSWDRTIPSGVLFFAILASLACAGLLLWLLLHLHRHSPVEEKH